MGMQPASRERLQWLLVMVVLLFTVGMSVRNNDYKLLQDLTTLCFGYYFGSASSNPPVK